MFDQKIPETNRNLAIKPLFVGTTAQVKSKRI